MVFFDPRAKAEQEFKRFLTLYFDGASPLQFNTDAVIVALIYKTGSSSQCFKNTLKNVGMSLISLAPSMNRQQRIAWLRYHVIDFVVVLSFFQINFRFFK